MFKEVGNRHRKLLAPELTVRPALKGLGALPVEGDIQAACRGDIEAAEDPQADCL